jgi:hypothetical protein
MSATFTLDYTDESSERLAAAVTSYGLGTRSYNASPEKHEVDRQRRAATEAFESAPREQIEVPPMCTCSQRTYPHELDVHSHLPSEAWNPQNRFRWPWSLMLLEESGQAILEFAVILPIFLMLCFGMIDMQMCLQDVANVNYIVNEVARCQAIAGTLCSDAPNTPRSYADLQARNLHMKTAYLTLVSASCNVNSCTATISFKYHALGIWFPGITFVRTGTAALAGPPTG